MVRAERRPEAAIDTRAAPARWRPRSRPDQRSEVASGRPLSGIEPLVSRHPEVLPRRTPGEPRRMRAGARAPAALFRSPQRLRVAAHRNRLAGDGASARRAEEY